MDSSQFVSATDAPPRSLYIQEITKIPFKPQLGCCNSFKATLLLREGAQPKYCKVKELPFALKPVVGAEPDRSKCWRKSLTQTEPLPWYIVVRKPGGKVRLCGDFKVTLNPALKTDVYPFPLPEELFQKLNGGHKFSKLDLAEPCIFTDSSG